MYVYVDQTSLSTLTIIIFICKAHPHIAVSQLPSIPVAAFYHVCHFNCIFDFHLLKKI